MATSEIEKLERRYAENPNGLTFAPLAEMYRKSGEIDRALELLAAGIERYPEYIPARIVLGRCHLDRDQIGEAEASFTRVLALDGENVIALKALADINERLGRYDDAERWLQSLLSVDRSNELAREQLARVSEAREQAGATAATSSSAPALESAPDQVPELSSIEPAPAVEAAPALEVHSTAGVDAIALDVAEPAPLSPEPIQAAGERPADSGLAWISEPEAPTSTAAENAASDELLVIEEPTASVEAVPPLDGVELNEMVTLDEAAAPVAGLVTPDVDAIHDQPAHNAGFDPVPLDEEFRIETADDLVLRPSNASEFQMPDASQDLVAAKPEPDPLGGIPMVEESAIDPVVEAEPQGVPAAASAIESAATPAEATGEPEAPSGPESTSEPESDAAHGEPGLIVTETMAEVLVKQGYTADALRIYRELERRDPNDARVRARRRELESGIAEPAKPRSYAARDTGGRSVGALFRDLLGARLDVPRSRPASTPPAVSSAPSEVSSTTGAPTRPAADSLSLSAVFGEDSSPVPPAVPAAPKGDLSFDEFFGGARGAGAPAPSPRAPTSRHEDDLDQFNAWLQNLKR